MNRRGFLGSLVGGIAAAAAVRTFPFRVYSFPTEPAPILLAALPDEMFLDTPLYDVYLRYARIPYWNDPRMQCRITGITVPTADEVELYA